jgi:hypothetical protein
MNKWTKNRIVQVCAGKGYPGFHKLRASCYHPLLRRLDHAQGTQGAAQVAWKMLPPRYFWPTVREYAREWGVKSWVALIRLVDLPVDPAQSPPHPLLYPR